MKSHPFNFNPETLMSDNQTANMRLTATDNAVLRYNISLNPDTRKKLRKYFRLFAKSDVFLNQINDEHEYKDFIFLAGQAYEVAYRDCGRDQLETVETPLDLFLSFRQALDSNVRICLVTPLTQELLSHIDNWHSVGWLQPPDVDMAATAANWRDVVGK